MKNFVSVFNKNPDTANFSFNYLQKNICDCKCCVLDSCWYLSLAPTLVAMKSKTLPEEWSFACPKAVCLCPTEPLNSNRAISETNFQHSCAKGRASTGRTDVSVFLWQFYHFCTCAECVKFQKRLFNRTRKRMKATQMFSRREDLQTEQVSID